MSLSDSCCTLWACHSLLQTFHQDALRQPPSPAALAARQAPAGPRWRQPAHWPAPSGWRQPELGMNVGVYLNDSHKRNGCLWVIPGTHAVGHVELEALPTKTTAGGLTVPASGVCFRPALSPGPLCRGFLAHRSLAPFIGLKGCVFATALPVEVNAGDAILHSRCVAHGSLPNQVCVPNPCNA